MFAEFVSVNPAVILLIYQVLKQLIDLLSCVLVSHDACHDDEEFIPIDLPVLVGVNLVDHVKNLLLVHALVECTHKIPKLA